MVSAAFWKAKKVFLTGHSGFKGSWLTLWLHRLGAQVHGYSRDLPTRPALFEAARLDELCTSHWGDLNDAPRLREALARAQPDIVIHMAAQTLVLPSYQEPEETFLTNVMGTVGLLQAVRNQAGVASVLVITSDKCYAPPVPAGGYPENHPLGGHDPYSASKACAEIVSECYRRSFARDWGLATGRAGNVIGGGDWAEHRILPDLMRALSGGGQVAIRSPQATRPWQHVLDPLHGYLLLLEKLAHDPQSFGGGWNFGPSAVQVRSVRDLVELVERRWGPCARWVAAPSSAPPEAPQLELNSEQACRRLGWQPRLDFETAVRWSVDWYRDFYAGKDARELMLANLELFDPCPAA